MSTMKGALAPAAAVLPAKSLAVPAAMEMPSVPSPVMLEIVTVRVLPLPETLNVPVAEPAVLSEMSVGARVIAPRKMSA